MTLMTHAQFATVCKASAEEYFAECRRFLRRWIYERYRHGAIRVEGEGRAALVMTVGDREVFVKWADWEEG